MKSMKSTVLGTLAVGLLVATVSTGAFAAPAGDLAKVCAKEHASDVNLKAAEAKYEEVKKAETAADEALKAARAKEKETDVLRAQAAAELAKAVLAEKALDSKEARAIAAARRTILANNARIIRLQALTERTNASLVELKALLVKEKNGQEATCKAPQLDDANKSKYTAEDIKEAEQACKEDKSEVKGIEDRIAGAEKIVTAAHRGIDASKAQNARLAKVIAACNKG